MFTIYVIVFVTETIYIILIIEPISPFDTHSPTTLNFQMVDICIRMRMFKIHIRKLMWTCIRK